MLNGAAIQECGETIFVKRTCVNDVAFFRRGFRLRPKTNSYDPVTLSFELPS